MSNVRLPEDRKGRKGVASVTTKIGMRTMRATPIGPSCSRLILAIAAFGFLTACSPATHAISAIGFDNQGRLIGGVKSCGESIVVAHLKPTAPENATDLATWRRDSPLKGTEYWPLGQTKDDPWHLSIHGSEPLELDRSTGYVFWAATSNGGGRTDFLVFRYSDLARLSRQGHCRVRYGWGCTADEGHPDGRAFPTEMRTQFVAATLVRARGRGMSDFGIGWPGYFPFCPQILNCLARGLVHLA